MEDFISTSRCVSGVGRGDACRVKECLVRIYWIKLPVDSPDSSICIVEVALDGDGKVLVNPVKSFVDDEQVVFGVGLIVIEG